MQMYRYSEILMCKPLLIYLCKPQILKNCFVISDVGCTCDSVCKLAAIVGLCHKAVIILNMYFFLLFRTFHFIPLLCAVCVKQFQK